MTTQEALSKISAAISSGSLADAELALVEFRDHSPKGQFCNVEICNGDGVTIRLPNGSKIPGILKDSIMVMQSCELAKCGCSKVELQLLVKLEDIKYM